MPQIIPDTGFSCCLDELREAALSLRIRADVFDSALTGVEPLEKVLHHLNTQPETNLSLAAYMARVLPPERLTRARSVLRKHRDLMNQIEAQYGPEPSVVVAIWGVETDFGRRMGDFPVLASLATLACLSHRRAFFRGELIAALRILQLGVASHEEMTGSWAGAMGHGQFMPSSYLDFAVDHDGDGRVDIWGADPADGLASVANYLAKHGWQRGQPWGQRVVLPEGFDLAVTGTEQVHPMRFWRARGLRLVDGGALADYGPASVLLPGGARGPAFLAFRNFHVLTSYNTAVPYAMAVGLLADATVDGRFAQVDWPDEVPLSRSEMREVQVLLAAAGHHPGVADGFIGPDTTAALRAWQTAMDLPPDGHAGHEALETLRRGAD